VTHDITAFIISIVHYHVLYYVMTLE